MRPTIPNPPNIPDIPAFECFEARLGDRSLFPDLQPLAYLNHAGISPASTAVRAAAGQVLADYGRRGVAAHVPWHRQRRRLKGRLAALIGARAEDLAWVSNTTAGLNAVAVCFPWRRGDRILVLQGEFPTNVTPWQRAAAHHGLELVFLPVDDFARPGGPDFDRLDAALSDGIRLLAVSAVQFQTGLRMPLEALAERCHARGAQICVDAIQACGGLPLRVAGLDYVAAGGHKWLMGPEGAGFLYIDPTRVGALRPHLCGWLSHEDAVGFLFEGPGRMRYDKPLKRTADFLEGGAPNAVGYAGLEAAVTLLQQLGPAAIAGHVGAYLDALEAGLAARGFRSRRAPDAARRSNILGLDPPDGVSAPALAAALDQRGVAASGPDGVLRFAPHWPNALTEVPAVLDAVDEALRGLRG